MRWTLETKVKGVASLWFGGLTVNTVVNRAVFAGLWAWSSLVDQAIPNLWLVGVGFVCAPWSAVAYTLMAAVSAPAGVQGFEWVLVAVAIGVDLLWYRDVLPRWPKAQRATEASRVA